MNNIFVIALAIACVLGLTTAQYGTGYGAAPSAGDFGQGGRKFDSVSISKPIM